MSSVALVLIRLGGSGLAFYKEHVALFRLVLPHPGSKLSVIFFAGKVSEFFSIS